jgi:hypothetical protein
MFISKKELSELKREQTRLQLVIDSLCRQFSDLNRVESIIQFVRKNGLKANCKHPKEKVITETSLEPSYFGVRLTPISGTYCFECGKSVEIESYK